MTTETADPSTPYDTCIAAIDQCDRRMRLGVIIVDEFIQALMAAINAYLPEQDVDDDLDLLLAYAREVVERRVGDPLDGDRHALDLFDRLVRIRLHQPVAMARLADLLEPIRSGARPDTLTFTLAELCRSGYSSHPTIFMFDEAVQHTLRTARELHDVTALAAAVSPESSPHDPALGHHAGAARKLAFDFLAELANRPDAVGDRALDVLVDLVKHRETCTEAAVRLPAHRLSAGQRRELMDAASAMDELLAAEVFQYPNGTAKRMPDAVRSVLWLSNDARRL